MWMWIQNWIDRWIFGRQKGLEFPETQRKETKIPDSYWDDRWSK